MSSANKGNFPRLSLFFALFYMLGRSPGEGNGNPLQYSYVENPMDRGDWQAVVHKFAKNGARLKWSSMDVRTYSCARAKRWNQCDLAGTCSWVGHAWEHHLLSSPSFSLENSPALVPHFLDDVLCARPWVNEPLNAFSGMSGWMSKTLCWGTATVPSPQSLPSYFPHPSPVPLAIVTYSHMWLPQVFSGDSEGCWGNVEKPSNWTHTGELLCKSSGFE